MYFDNLNTVPYFGFRGFDKSKYSNGAEPKSGRVYDLAYSTQSGDDKFFDPRSFPYSSAVENTAIFLLLCLTTQLSVYCEQTAVLCQLHGIDVAEPFAGRSKTECTGLNRKRVSIVDRFCAVGIMHSTILI